MEYSNLQKLIENSIPATPKYVLDEWEKVKQILSEGQGYLTKSKPIKVIFFKEL